MTFEVIKNEVLALFKKKDIIDQKMDYTLEDTLIAFGIVFMLIFACFYEGALTVEIVKDNADLFAILGLAFVGWHFLLHSLLEIRMFLVNRKIKSLKTYAHEKFPGVYKPGMFEKIIDDERIRLEINKRKKKPVEEREGEDLRF